MSKPTKSETADKARAPETARSFRVSGERLCSLRQSRGWTQVEAAERAGISERLIRRAEAGGSLGWRSIAVLADLYSTAQSPLSLDDLLGEPLAGRTGVVVPPRDIAAVVRRWHDELWNLGRLEVVAELAAAGCILHAHDKRIRGHAAVRRFIQATRAAVGRFQLVAQPPAIFGDLAMTRWRARLKDSPPARASGRRGGTRAAIRGSTWILVADGLLCEAWMYWHSPLPTHGTRWKKE